MPGPATKLLSKVLAETDGTLFGFCYDTSHEQMDGPRAYDLVDKFGDKLFAVHISDRSAPFVDHQIPGEGFIDWPTVMKKLQHSGFQNPLLLEVMMTHSKYREPNQFLSEAYKAACWLCS
jgi:sugar phosphate isomerase/epimerase